MHLLKLIFKQIIVLLKEPNYFEHYRVFFLSIIENFNQIFDEGFTQQLLRIYPIRLLVNVGRSIYFVDIMENLAVLESPTADVGKNAITHNLSAFENFQTFSIPRVDRLIKPFSSIELLNSNSSILVIGPRSEDDLLCLLGYGFKHEKIRGFDLISYSPWVDLGDMHAMPYEDNSWDAVIVGWVFNYSKAPANAAQEIIRVARNGAIIAIGIEYNPLTDEEIQKMYGYSIDGSRTQSVTDILNFFGESVDSVFFNHDIVAMQKDKQSELMVIFSLKK
ncbi:class I SAM-dependent methyltransferase [Nostoc sp. TCL26-01]|uniref:class I SAM-dependent methyltransferase n=1 Tax=Nostoc sp. TCL26-01 TaxID=2576904 RepID=UPI0015B80CF1|nr:methyltransferase domain-containing protein [Nostoc sp. TCL26-01]QLE59132.1 class I SAM-dependent methyltransferase [Nostoc sp. TCL26-01]